MFALAPDEPELGDLQPQNEAIDAFCAILDGDRGTASRSRTQARTRDAAAYISGRIITPKPGVRDIDSRPDRLRDEKAHGLALDLAP